LSRSSIGVLGTIVAGLSLAALASIEPERAISPPASVAPAPPPPAEAAVAQLRDGDALDVNQAGPSDLELLPGIGPSLARRIVEDRTRNGPFARAPARPAQGSAQS
jgi:competence protein ComEA